MKKTTLLVLTLTAIIGFNGCTPEELTEVVNEDNDYSFVYEDYEHNTPEDALSFLNRLRTSSGLPAFSFDEKLNTMASNHAKYLNYNNLHGHTEDEEKEFFTGVTPCDRADYVSYDAYKGEVLSRGYKTYIGSIQGLMSAIYHRFIFFSLNADAIGFVYENERNILVADEGNTQIQSICNNGVIYSTYGQSYYSSICANGKLLPTSIYQSARDSIKKASPKAILYPYENQQDFRTYFANSETPDPLPDIDKHVGSPISIQFNDYYVKDVQMYSFELYENNETLLTDVRILDMQSDPNQRFDQYEYALFPLEVLKKDSWYKVEAHFTLDGRDWDKIWYFKTQE